MNDLICGIFLGVLLVWVVCETFKFIKRKKEDFENRFREIRGEFGYLKNLLLEENRDTSRRLNRTASYDDMKGLREAIDRICGEWRTKFDELEKKIITMPQKRKK